MFMLLIKYYQVFAKPIKPLLPEPQLSNSYHLFLGHNIVKYNFLQWEQASLQV